MEQITRARKIADLAWLGLALLQYEFPERLGFTPSEILARIKREGIVEPLPPGVAIHISSHGVASLSPNPGRYRLFTRVPPNRYRLFKPGDQVHPARTGKTCPERGDMPGYEWLIDWYQQWTASVPDEESDPILQLRGLGKEIWSGIDGVEYQRSLRAEEEHIG